MIAQFSLVLFPRLCKFGNCVTVNKEKNSSLLDFLLVTVLMPLRVGVITSISWRHPYRLFVYLFGFLYGVLVVAVIA